MFYRCCDRAILGERRVCPECGAHYGNAEHLDVEIRTRSAPQESYPVPLPEPKVPDPDQTSAS